MIKMKINEFKNRIFMIIRNRIIFRPSNIVQTRRYGNQYGGFDLAEGLFLHKRSMIVYSFGIGEDLSFSEDVIRFKNGCLIYAFDPTPKSITYVSKCEINQYDKFYFFDIGLSDKDESRFFYLPIDEQNVSGSVKEHEGLQERGIIVKMKCLNTIANELKHKTIDVLKLDIEGSEFDIVDSIVNFEGTINQVCMETHERFMRFPIISIYRLNNRLKKNGYVLVANDGETITYVNRKALRTV